MSDEHVMVDIETLGTDPGAAIVSIGAVSFDADGLDSQFFKSVDVESAQAAGLAIDAETLGWWLEQSDEAREQLFGGNQLRACLRQLSEFIGDRVVWACSPAFDVVLLEAAYDAVGLATPWRFYRCRDYRSMREQLETWPDREQSGTAHNALDDAVFQAACLVEAVNDSDEVTL